MTKLAYKNNEVELKWLNFEGYIEKLKVILNLIEQDLERLNLFNIDELKQALLDLARGFFTNVNLTTTGTFGDFGAKVNKLFGGKGYESLLDYLKNKENDDTLEQIYKIFNLFILSSYEKNYQNIITAKNQQEKTFAIECSYIAIREIDYLIEQLPLSEIRYDMLGNNYIHHNRYKKKLKNFNNKIDSNLFFIEYLKNQFYNSVKIIKEKQKKEFLAKYENLKQEELNIKKQLILKEEIKKRRQLKGLKKPIDLRKYPHIYVYNGNLSIETTIGDLHANVIKFINFLIAEDVLILDKDKVIAKKLYDELYEIYITGMDFFREEFLMYESNSFLCDLGEKKLIRFKEIIDNAELNDNKVVRLIGDELSDRGGNDYLMFLMFDKLINSNLDFRVILSNHGANALKIYNLLIASVDYDDFKQKYKTKTGLNFVLDITGKGTDSFPMDFNFQCCSVHGLFNLLEQKIITIKDISNLYKKYLGTLKLVDYSINELDEIIIYTHAPIDFYELNQIFEYFYVNPVDDIIDIDVFELAKKIDLLNYNFLKILNDYPDMIISKFNVFDNICSEFIWIRRSEHEYKYGMYYIPKNIKFVHGHDGLFQSIAKDQINLNSNCGKLSLTGDMIIFRAIGEIKRNQVKFKI